MVTVAQILELPVFDNVRLAAPCEDYLSRQVVNCGTLDSEPFFHDYDLFVAGELIFTSLGFAERFPDLAEEALLALIERDVAAIAIRPYAMKELPDSVKEASERSGVPVFFYDGRYMERVLYSAMSLIDADAIDSGRSKLIDQLLSPSDERQVSALLYEISGLNGVTVQCLAIRPTRDDAALLRALFGNVRQSLELYASRFDEVGDAFVCIYDDMVLGFVSFKRPPLSVITISEANLARYISQIGPLHCGLSQELPLGEGDLALRQAIAALETACASDEPTVRFTALRYDAFHAAACSDRMFARTAHLIASLLQEHDAASNTSLYVTAVALAHARGDVRAAAEELFQHPNTIRYRLGRIKEVLGMPDASDREMGELLSFMTLGTAGSTHADPAKGEARDR